MFHLRHNNTNLGFKVLCTVRNNLHYLNNVKSRQISNILMCGFLSKCKNGFDFAMDQLKSLKK